MIVFFAHRAPSRPAHRPLPSFAKTHGLKFEHANGHHDNHGSNHEGHGAHIPTTVWGQVKHEVGHHIKETHPLFLPLESLGIVAKIPGSIGRALFGGFKGAGSIRDTREMVELQKLGEHDPSLAEVRRIIHSSDLSNLLKTQEGNVDALGRDLRQSIKNLEWAQSIGKLEGLSTEHIETLKEFAKMRLFLIESEQYFVSHWMNAARDKSAAEQYMKVYQNFWAVHDAFQKAVKEHWNEIETTWKAGTRIHLEREEAAKKK